MIITRRMLENNPIPSHRGLTVAAAEREISAQVGEEMITVLQVELGNAHESKPDTPVGTVTIHYTDLMQALQRSGEYA